MITINLLANKCANVNYNDVVVQNEERYKIVEGENRATQITVNYPAGYEQQAKYVAMKNARGEFSTVVMEGNTAQHTIDIPSTMTYPGNIVLVFVAGTTDAGGPVKTVWMPVSLHVESTGVNCAKIAQASPDLILQCIALSTRVLEGEAAREEAEEERLSAETARENAESARQSSEAARETAESRRAIDENARRSAEEFRVAEEMRRAAAERDRASAETQRTSAEAARVSAEDLRASAETARASAENSRASAEAARESASQAATAAANGAAIAAETAAEEAAAAAAMRGYITTEIDENGHLKFTYHNISGIQFVIVDNERLEARYSV